MEVGVTIVEDNYPYVFKYNLPQGEDALIGDLKAELANKEGVDDPDNRLRLTFKTDSGDELGKLINTFLEVSILMFQIFLSESYNSAIYGQE